MKPNGQLVTCESFALVVLHARAVGKVTPVQLGGHTAPYPATLCGTEAAWDTKRPIAAVRCPKCIAEIAKRSATVDPRGGR